MITSDIPNKRVRGTALYNIVFPYSPGIPGNPPYIAADEANYHTNDAFVQQVNNWRNTYKADLVVFVTNRGYASAATGQAIFGLAEAIPSYPNPGAYRAIAEAPYLLAPHFVLAHELGHLLGCNHLFGGGEVCPHAFVFEAAGGEKFKTVVAEGGAAGARILRYSNPDVKYNGAATGDPTHDNARNIRNSACYIDDYRTSPLLEVGIPGSGTKALCNMSGTTTPLTFSALITNPAAPSQPGQPPYTYQWQVSDNALFNTSTLVIGGGSSITISGPPFFCPSFWLRVKVTGSNGYVAYSSSTQISAKDCPQCGGQFQSPIVNNAQNWRSMEGKNLSVYPNPACDFLNVEFSDLEGEEYIEIDMVNENGQVLRHSKCLPSAESKIQINLESLPLGSYFLRLKGSAWLHTQRIAIIR